MNNMTDQQIFTAHKDQIQKKILTENNRRVKLLRVPVLTPDETQVAVTEMIGIIREGGRVAEYKFEDPEPAIQQQSDTSKAVGPRQSAQKLALNGESIKFDIVMCSNGFVLNMDKNGMIQPFIFKTEKELMEIFKESLFEKLKKMKEKKEEKLNGSSGIQETDQAENPPETEAYPRKDEQTGSSVCGLPESATEVRPDFGLQVRADQVEVS